MDQTTEKKSYFLAILASICLALVGGIVYGFVYYTGYISYLATAIIYPLASIGIKKVMKKDTLSKLDSFLLFIISIVVSVLAVFSVNIIIIMMECGCGFTEAFELLKLGMQDPTVRGALAKDITTGACFVIFGVISVAIADRRRAKKSQQ